MRRACINTKHISLCDYIHKICVESRCCRHSSSLIYVCTCTFHVYKCQSNWLVLHTNDIDFTIYIPIVCGRRRCRYHRRCRQTTAIYSCTIRRRRTTRHTANYATYADDVAAMSECVCVSHSDTEDIFMCVFVNGVMGLPAVTASHRQDKKYENRLHVVVAS